jgi:hypothetical protein
VITPLGPEGLGEGEVEGLSAAVCGDFGTVYPRRAEYLRTEVAPFSASTGTLGSMRFITASWG